MNLTYNDIISTLFIEEIGKYIPEGMAHSFPIIGSENGRIVDCFFLFSYSYSSAKFNSPTARLAIEPESKRLVYYYDVNTKPFENGNESHSYPLEFKYSKDERSEALGKYQESYMSVREFAFTDNISTAQITNIIDYIKAFNILISDWQKPFYVALSPVFFEWITASLKRL